MTAAAVAAISAAILGYEVLLVRLFAIVQWHHFAFMAISIALLGFGVSGTLLALRRRWFLARGAGAFAAAAVIFALTAPAAFLLAQRLPFNPLEIAWNPAELALLGAIYLLLAVPFTAGATCVGLAFMAGGAPGRVYLWNLVGSGTGALAMAGALSVLAPAGCLAAVAALGLAAAALSRPRLAALGGLALIAAWAAAPPGWLELRISDYKGLSQALRVQGARLVRERSGAVALVSAVASPAVPFRHAPGLSLLSPALPGPQIGLFVDGDAFDAIEAFDGGAAPAHLAWSTDALAYAVATRPRVLVLGAGGGRAVLQAVAAGAAHVDVVEADANLIRMVREDFAGFAGGLYGRPDVTVHGAEPRSFLAGTDGAWDVIRLPDVGASGAAAGGRGLSESFLLTREAFELCYRRLAPGGWLSVTGAVDLPPRAALRVAATALAALERSAVERPGESLVLIRGLTTFTLLMKRGAVGPGDIAALRDFAAARAFDLGYYPGMARAEANRLNVLAEPAFFDGIVALTGPGRDAFVARYKFDIRPVIDDRPYFHDFFRWRSAPELVALRSVGGAAMLEWGEIVVAATLVQAVGFSALLILLPLRLGSRPAGVLGIGGYFFLLGLAFLFVEIAFIQRFTLYLGHPVHAVAVALTGFLVFAGLGAGASGALGRRLGPGRAVAAAVAGIAVVALGYLVALPGVFTALAHLPGGARVAVSLALIAPLAFGMGIPFPLGLARVADRDPALVPWAWGLNGCASVISAAAATLLAMNFGFAATVLTAVALYGAAALAFPAAVSSRRR